MKPNIAIVLVGGSGKRLGADRPKQFLRVRGKTIMEHTVNAFEENDNIAEIAIVSNPNFIREVEQIVKESPWKKVKHVLAGGKERYDSSMAALKAYQGKDVNLLLHDGVRPLVSQAVINRVCQALETHQAIGVALPAVDTIVEADHDCITATPDRSRLRRMQTPQAFRYEIIAEAYRRALADPHFKATDDCGVVIKYMPEIEVHLVEGEESNLKLTYKEDLPILERHFSQREAAQTQLVKKSAEENKFAYLQRYAQRNLREMQLKMLDILVELRDLLDRNEIDYWLDDSTLLGAVRHGGFIPWGEDANICIHHIDMPRFIAIAQKELPTHLLVQFSETATSSSSALCKVKDITTFILEQNDSLKAQEARGIYVNIRPMQMVPSFDTAYFKKVSQKYCHSNEYLLRPHVCSFSTGLKAIRATWNRKMWEMVWSWGRLKYNMNEFYAYPLAENPKGIRHMVGNLLPLSEIEFEGEKFKAPANEDLYLKEIFGEYMQQPSGDQRPSHLLFYHTDLR